MSFTSLAYLLLLPLIALASAALAARPRAHNLLLLGFSLFFYGWWDARFLALLAATIVVDWAVALRIEATASAAGRRRWLALSVGANLLVLGCFKYADFFLASLRQALGTLGVEAPPAALGLVLPVGISFYTFQSISYVVDVYRRRMAACADLVDYALYVSFFPQLVAGPIERGTSLLPQLRRPRRPRLAQVREGAWLILHGLFLKLAIGDVAGRIADGSLANPRAGALALATGLVAFSIQIYGDFAGYSTIARGSAKLVGVELMINFATPYFATSITDFWRRWHISLSTFLRDYLYVPLGGNRKGPARAALNLMLVMLLGGLWHGASWKFVVWGGLHGVYLAVHKALGRRGGRVPATASRAAAALKGAFVFALVTLTWAFFRAPDVATALGWLGRLFTLAPGAWSPQDVLVLVLTALFALPLELLGRIRRDDAAPLSWPWWLRGPLYAGLAWAALGGIGGRQPFLYFQF